MRFIFPTGIYEKVTNKDKPNGYAGLDSNTKLNFDEMPDLLMALVYINL